MLVTDRLVVLKVAVESKTSIQMQFCLASFQYTVAELLSDLLGFTVYQRMVKFD